MPENHTNWTDQLSLYLDGELGPAARAELETHLASCVACRSVLEDLRSIVAQAPNYGGTAPDSDLWPAIRSAIDAGREVKFVPRQQSAARLFTLPQLIAASIAFAVIAGGAVYWTVGRPAPTPPPVVVQAPVSSGPTGLPVSARAGAAFDLAVSELEQVLKQGRDQLDPKTLKIIQDNLSVIDRAIAEARAAIAADPANSYLSEQVAANMHRKLEILRSAANAIAARET
jgi:anti-sigma factor RsiW